MIKLRYGLLFPLALALLLGGLTAWLERISHVETESVQLNPNEPQYEMHVLSGKRYDAAGNLQESLHAERAWQLPEQKNVFLQQADLQRYQHGERQYRVTAASARYQTDSKQVFFEQGVLLKKDATATQPDGEIRTQRLIVDTQTETARTDAPVNFRYGASSGSAKGMTYNHQTGRLDLPAQVKAIIHDIKQP